MNPLSPIYYIRNNKGRSALIIFMNLLCDILYQVVDPRIKIG